MQGISHRFLPVGRQRVGTTTMRLRATLDVKKPMLAGAVEAGRK